MGKSEADARSGFAKFLKLGEASMRIVEYVLCSPDPVTPKELVENLGLSEGTVWNALSRLSKAGFLISTGRGEYKANQGYILAMILLVLVELYERRGRGSERRLPKGES
ncbi:MAG: helix-turn-helix domain-containing protein [Candidatus Freyarchaeota archaeon]|nr:helix-turn-helix domain-containing protein [Candidatus Jordarchaeia archaeon]